MTAPSLKEVLELVIASHENNTWSSNRKGLVSKSRAALATLSPPAGERREAIARIIDPGAFAALGNSYVVPTVYEFSRMKIAREKADLVLASGLVQDEAAIRADEREKCAEIADRAAGVWDSDNNMMEYSGLTVAAECEGIAAAIRSARDWGAES